MTDFLDLIRIRFLEYFGLIDADLVATVEQVVEFVDDDEDEVITYYLRQFPSGRRFFSTHAYGASGACKLDQKYAGPVMAWVLGGPLPKNAEVVRKTAIVLNLFEGGGGDTK